MADKKKKLAFNEGKDRPHPFFPPSTMCAVYI